MTLVTGQKLGPYEIVAAIGAGGMGEVYRARDTRLGREVAIKVSQGRFNERFDREAHVISSLNHPNICALYDIGPDYLVMEYVEGDAPRGPMPVDDALAIAMQIVDALQEAHERGIVHRDLKPANIRITPSGKVKVLDFGLAKMGGTATVSSDNSPTISMGGTQAGVILGTAAYMAPEQARGKPVDARADIWAFGVVLYEMIIGDRLFKGDDLTETLASVVKDHPDLSAVPRRVRRLLDACLQKDPKKRLQSIGDVRLLLDNESPASSSASRRSVSTVALAAVAGVAMVTAAALAYVHLRETPPLERVLRLSLPLPDGTPPGFLEVSPDGKRLLMAARVDGVLHLYVRSLESGDLKRLAGTSDERLPFWSYDGRFIGFFQDGKLQVMPAAGGPTQVLCDETGAGAGATWSRTGLILFADEGGRLHRVDGAGGECRGVGTADSAMEARSPTFMPDGDHFFYSGVKRNGTEPPGVYLASLEEPIGKRILPDPSSVLYAPPAAARGLAHLLFRRQGNLMAQPFDETRLETVGDPFEVAERVSSTLNDWHPAASIAADGTLVYLSGRSTEKQLTWFDRTGKELGTIGPRGIQNGIALTRDGSLATITRQVAGEAPSQWTYDVVRGSETRQTPVGAYAQGALWFPDSTRILFGLFSSEGAGQYQRNVKSGEQELLQKLDRTVPRIPSDLSADGRLLIYTATDPKTRADIWYAPMESGKPNWQAGVKVVGTAGVDSLGQVSPDGKWLAYYSGENGADQVYVRSFPSGSAVWKVSIERGTEPRWRADGKELYFIGAIGNRVPVMAASVEADGQGGLRVGVPQRLFDVRLGLIVPQDNVFSYSVHPDGRFLMNTLADSGEPTVNVVIHWQQAVAGAVTPTQ